MRVVEVPVVLERHVHRQAALYPAVFPEMPVYSFLMFRPVFTPCQKSAQ
jgi:hypothetical protein